MDARVKLARNTAYSLIGVGLHGSNGLNPKASCRIIQTYVVPRLLYGLEAICLNKTEVEKLESFYRNLLRMIQGLNDRCANEAVYLLPGVMPISAQLHSRVLGLAGSISRLPGHLMNRLAL